MYKITYDITFESLKYIAIYGQMVKEDDSLDGACTYSFQKVTEGKHVTTCREHLEQFDTYQELYNFIETNFPEQLDYLMPERIMQR